MPIPVQKLGWMAGIIDMKGRIVHKNNTTRNTKQVTLYVESKEIGIVRALSEMTGTRPEMKAAEETPAIFTMRHNCREHCPEAHVHVGPEDGALMPQRARWTVSGAAMVVVLHNLRPYLVMDRGWDEVADMVTNVTVTNGRGWTAVQNSLNRLLDLGWALPLIFATALEGDDEDED